MREVSEKGRSRIRKPFPQKEARHRPIIAIVTTEHAGGTACVLPRNCVASSPAKVELCMPVHNEIVLVASSSCLSTKFRSSAKYHNRKPILLIFLLLPK